MKKANLVIRFIAFYIDLLLAIAVTSPLLFLELQHLPTELDPFLCFKLPYTYLALILILLKDVSGRSAGKHIMKLYLVQKDGSVPPVWKRILRNITCFIWPIEALIALISKDGTRFADKVFGTNVITHIRPIIYKQ